VLLSQTEFRQPVLNRPLAPERRAQEFGQPLSPARVAPATAPLDETSLP
jgi:hypothetical protein